MKASQASPVSEFRSVGVRYEPDEGPGRYRIGLVVPAEDAVSERDFRLMQPSDEVAVFTTRIETTQVCTVEELRKMGPLLSKTASLVLTDDRIDVLAFSCTSATVAIGFERVAASLRESRPEIPVVTPITAALAAFRTLDVDRVAVLTPYPDDVNATIRDFIEQHGVEVTKFAAFHGLLTDYEVSRIPPQAIYEAGLEMDDPRIQAVFISCTGIRAVEIADQLERALGKPVITSNQAMCWQCLRSAGYAAPVPGFGRLLRE